MPRHDDGGGEGRSARPRPRTGRGSAPGPFARFASRIDPRGADGSHLLACLSLAAAGGFADAASYVLTGSFTGHVTGNTLLAAIGAVDRDWPRVVACSVAVVSFLIGTAAGAAWPHPSGRSRPANMLVPILAEAGLVCLGLAATAAFRPGDPAVVLGFTCLALGLQNGTLNKFGSVSIHGTYITGMSTSLVVTLVKRSPDDRRAILPPVIGSFVGGASVGALAVRRAGVPGVAAILVPFGLAAILAMLSARARYCVEPDQMRDRVGPGDRPLDGPDTL